MVRLRPFKRQDAERILPWICEERVMAMWCAGVFSYPLTVEQLTDRMEQSESKADEWVMAGIDEQGEVIGHLYMWPDYQNDSLHLGMIVVDHTRRGQGLGRQMVEKAAAYAFDILEVSQVTLGVFDSNPRARACYQSAGFVVNDTEEHAFVYHGESWDRIHMIRRRES